MRAAAVAAVLGLLACTTGEAAAGGRAPSKPVMARVTIEAMKFSPADIVVKPGATIVWTNNDIVAHTVTSKAGGFDSKIIPPGATWKLVVKRKGDFAYICSLHPMTAAVRVR